MNKEIKFRAFNTKTNKMYDVRSLHNLHSQVNIHADLCNPEKGGNAVMSNHYTESPNQSDFVYMQFTGLKDKNGKEIYEGDIITNKYGSYGGVIKLGFYENEKFTKHDQKRKHIGFYFEGEKVESLEDECWYIDAHYNPIRTNNIKVIGNIYENPELFK